MRAPETSVSAPQWVAGVIQHGLRRVGYHLSRWPPQYTLERHLFDIFQLLDINCVLDVGANLGAYAQLLRQIGYAGRIISFEPSSQTYRELCRAMSSDPNWVDIKSHSAMRKESRNCNCRPGASSIRCTARERLRLGADPAIT